MFLKTTECKKYFYNTSRTSKLYVSKGTAFYDEISSCIKWNINYSQIFQKDKLMSFVSYFRSNNSSSNGIDNITLNLECCIDAPFDIIFHDNYDSKIQLDYVFQTSQNHIHPILADSNCPLLIKNANVHYNHKNNKVALNNVHVKYSQSLTAFYDVKFQQQDE